MKQTDLYRILALCAVLSLAGCGVSDPVSEPAPDLGWMQVSWSGDPVSMQCSNPNSILSRVLDVPQNAFAPEHILGGPGIRTLLEFDSVGNLVAVHTTCDMNKQWVTDSLPVSDTFFLHNARTSAIPMASPTVTVRDGVLEISDAINGPWKYGSIQVDIVSRLSGLVLDQPSRGILTQTATFTVTRDIPSFFLLAFAGVKAGETLTLEWTIPVAFEPVASPAADGFGQCQVIVTRAGLLPRDIGIQGGAFARQLEVMGLLNSGD